jgi:alanine-synthesizing transaminase
MLASMRLCANVPAQHAIQTALGGYQSISEFIPGGRLYEQRNRAWELINDIPGVSCMKPKGALYMFPKIDAKRFNIHDDQKMVLDFLLQEKVLLVQGTAFNWPWPDHVRIVTLPREDDLEMAIPALAASSPATTSSDFIVQPPGFASGGNPCAQWHPMLSLIKGSYESESFLCPPLPPETD